VSVESGRPKSAIRLSAECGCSEIPFGAATCKDVASEETTDHKVKMKLSLCLTKHHVMETYLVLNYALGHEHV
jgi:hypothetical protein